jgi:hypothetical protein
MALVTNYTTWLSAVANLLPTETTNTGLLNAVLPAIDYAEQRIYRDLDLIFTINRDSSAALVAGSRAFNIPSANGSFVVVDYLNVITPAGTVNPEAGARNQLLPVSKEFLDAVFPSVTGSGLPTFVALVGQNLAIVGPWPNANYQVEVVGTIRPGSLSTSSPTATTFLTVNLSDLFFSASMIFFTGGLQHNFGAQSDEPRSSLSWEAIYQQQLTSANTEENRKKWASQGWTSKQPAPLATPPRS